MTTATATLILAVVLLVCGAVPEDGRWLPLWRFVGVLALGFVGWHFFNVWGVLAVAGLALCRKV